MALNDAFEMFECALSKDKHFVKDPIILPSCNHVVCKRCLFKNSVAILVKCKKCNVESEQDLRDECVSLETEQAMKFNLANLLRIIETRTTYSLEQLKCLFIYLFISIY